MKKRVKLRALTGLIAVTMLLLLAPSVQSLEYTVTSIDDLQAAINTAENGDTIVLAAGLDGAVLPNALTINGKSLIFKAQTGTVTLYPPASSGENRRHIYVTGGDVALTFDGVLLDGGTNSGGINDGQKAGGISISSGNLTLRNAVIRNCSNNLGGAVSGSDGCDITITGDGTLITNNKASTNGGGVYGTICTITVEAGEISGNTSVNGGGICAGAPDLSSASPATASTVNITGGKIINNHAVPDSSTNWNGSGGGIFAGFYCKINISGNTVISGNDANYGGGIFGNRYSAINISDAVISGNTASRANGGGGLGGGIDAENYSTVSISRNTKIQNNTAYQGGGILGQIYSVITIADSTLSGNSATNGGGIATQGTSLNVSDSIITGNTAAGPGGGILSLDAAILVKDSKINYNTASQGGGIMSYAGFASYPNAKVEITGNTVISDNAATDEPGMGSGGGIFMYTRSYLTVGPNVIFTRNTAPNGYAWTVNSAASDPNDNESGSHNAKIQTTNFTDPFTNAYNNFDVNYRAGEAVQPAKVTVTYYQDAVGGTSLGNRTFNTYVGAEIGASTIAAALGAEWKDLYRPTGYNAGEVQQTLPITMQTSTADVIVLYILSPATTYTVTYDANGGTGSYADANLASGSPYTVKTLYATGIYRSGYTFIGWNTEVNGSGTAYTAGSTMNITGNVTLFAQWRLGEVTPTIPPTSPIPTLVPPAALPQTGANDTLGWAALLILLSAAMALTLLSYRKWKRQEEK